VLQVVEKCHELGILHGDLKPANFVLADRTRNPLFSKDINLLFGEPWLLAIDFGCSQYLGSQRFTKRTGTPGEKVMFVLTESAGLMQCIGDESKGCLWGCGLAAALSRQLLAARGAAV
jgi:hypothetical protein